MRVGWLCDSPGYTGGAELTQAEFKSAAPEDVEILDCPPGGVVPRLDRYVVQNCAQYSMADMQQMGYAPAIKYVHDLWPHGDPHVRRHLLDRAKLIFCSPLHLQKFRWEIPDWTVTKIIPPALDLTRFKPPRQVRRNGKREGTCAIAQWRNPGKGAQQLLEWADQNGPVHVYGDGAFVPDGGKLEAQGPVEQRDMPTCLWSYKRFVFLPTDMEPFCRTVVEAWAAGCDLVVNDLIGARHFIEEEPDALKTAGERFWEAVCG